MAAAVLASWPRFCAAGKSRAIYSGERGAPEELHRVHQSRQTRTMVRWGIGVRLTAGGAIRVDFLTAIGPSEPRGVRGDLSVDGLNCDMSAMRVRRPIDVERESAECDAAVGLALACRCGT